MSPPLQGWELVEKSIPELAKTEKLLRAAFLQPSLD
jgi:hypothetical protein